MTSLRATNTASGEGASRIQAATLATPAVHLGWVKTYRNSETQRFYELAMDRVVGYLGASPGDSVLDVGCGTGSHSVRLARRGLRCVSVDFSQAALDAAQEHIREQQLEDRITLHRHDITAMPFESGSFDRVLCWGVLMHIPDLTKAVAEVCRVLKPGGTIVISESNMHSCEWLARSVSARVLGEKRRVTRTPAGMEYWAHTSSGPLFVRVANIGYLVDMLRRSKVDVETRCAGQFTEAYMRFSWPAARKAVHLWNEAWFRFARLPRPSMGNVLVGRKQA